MWREDRLSPCLCAAQDMVKFGNSSREYVLLHENSTGVS